MEIKRNYTVTENGERAIDVLAQTPELSKAKIKDAMNKGAVQIVRKGKAQRLRRATAELWAGDVLQLHYDDDLLNRVAPPPRLIADCRRYSVWYKPAGLLAQGNEWGDHCAIARLVELHFNSQRKVFVVHRLDREARGLMLLAHDADAAAKLSQLFQQKQIEKVYHVIVRGQLPEQGMIDTALDGKAALTRYNRIAIDPEHNTSTARVQIDSGRKHQIRRHFDGIHHPVMGDPLYGQGNRDDNGLQLIAIRLTFRCPLSRQTQQFEINLNGELIV